MGQADTPGSVTTRLIHGDCLVVMPTLAPSSVSLVAADLPYSVTACAWDVAHDLGPLWTNFERLQTVNGVSALTSVQPFTTDLVVSNRKNFRYDIVWQKNRCSNFFQAKRRPMRQHETILIFASARHTYNAQKTTGRVRRDKNVRKSSGFHLNPTTYVQDGSGLKHPTTILSVCESETTTSSIQRHHPTQKPVALLEWLIKTYTNPGDTVLDPCAGSFTTAVACLRTGRSFIGIEKDAAYFATGVERVKSEMEASGVDATLVLS